MGWWGIIRAAIKFYTATGGSSVETVADSELLNQKKVSQIDVLLIFLFLQRRTSMPIYCFGVFSGAV